MTDLSIESQYTGKIIAGVDEVGRGSLAGPVVAAAVIVDQKNIFERINDSKKLSRTKRKWLFYQITSSYLWGVGIIEPVEIDKINILQATIKSCKIAVDSINPRAEIVIVDGNMKFDDERFHSIVKGDNKSVSIASASIVAKIIRDGIMTELANEFPAYKWNQNSGYGTKDHLNAIQKHGYTPHHRRSFKIKNLR